ncbi:hypothetical protein [uncultured Draconibacterium sp.]|uniref:hypothetical protein n=1 Tax=uncultured Draconibacterium sp. TaxID=1573823 RepID=UPI002AA61E8C|nr:hypothetical protein [uncultured Draconibacterium sp.]
MNKYKFLLVFAVFISGLLMFSSCEDDMEELIIPEINPSETQFDVDYKEGEVSIELNSNVIVYTTIDSEDKDWLSYHYQDSCKTLVLNYFENDTTADRIGHALLTYGDSTIDVTINQEGNPNAISGKKVVDIGYEITTVDYGGTAVTLFIVAAEETANIPVGAMVEIQCSGDDGTIMLIGTEPMITGIPSNGKFNFVWTVEMAAGDGFMARLVGGFDPVSMKAMYSQKSHLFETMTVDYGGTAVNLLEISAEEAANIPVGATVTIQCTSDEGTIMLIGTDPEISGSPVNGKFSFTWTATMAAGEGLLARIDGGFDPEVIYSISFKTELTYEITTVDYGGTPVTLFIVAAEQTANIPIGASVVIECSADEGTIMLIGTEPMIIGSPLNGAYVFTWTAELAAGDGFMARLDGGVDPIGMYCRN